MIEYLSNIVVYINVIILSKRIPSLDICSKIVNTILIPCSCCRFFSTVLVSLTKLFLSPLVYEHTRCGCPKNKVLYIFLRLNHETAKMFSNIRNKIAFFFQFPVFPFLVSFKVKVSVEQCLSETTRGKNRKFN